jgi:hypothetical protein
MAIFGKTIDDFLQAMSNSAASNVSGPVDLINAGLKKVNLGSERPVLGSRWMEENRLTRPVEQSGAGVGGETLGLLAAGPMAVPGRMATTAKEVAQAAELAHAMTPAAKAAPKLGTKASATVMRPQRVAFPGIYDDPTKMVAEAASRVAPENPLMKQLFGVTRGDLWELSQHGARKGNITERPFVAGAKAKGARHASEVMNPRNEARLRGIIAEAQKHPELYQGMASWYTMDPLFDVFKRVHGDKAVDEYSRFNTLTGMASPGSEVLTELNRGTAAFMKAKQGAFDDFAKFGGVKESARGSTPGFPDDLRAVIPHPYHKTAHSGPMGKYLESGKLDMQSAKVPSYIAASGVPETGFQTAWPVGDAHWSRLVGLPDVRGAVTIKGQDAVPNASASVPEMLSLGPWWRDKIAAPMGLEAVPAQAVVWGAGSGATGVTSPIGAGKLELLAQQVGKAAQRMGVSPEQALEMIVRGEAHAGKITPAVAAAIAAAAGAGLLGANAMGAVDPLAALNASRPPDQRGAAPSPAQARPRGGQ